MRMERVDALAGDSMPKTRLFDAYSVILRRDPCSYCGVQDAWIEWEPTNALGPSCAARWDYHLFGATRDHIVPRRSAADDVWDNLTAACRSCNSRKNATPLLLWLATR